MTGDDHLDTIQGKTVAAVQVTRHSEPARWQDGLPSVVTLSFTDGTAVTMEAHGYDDPVIWVTWRGSSTPDATVRSLGDGR